MQSARDRTRRRVLPAVMLAALLVWPGIAHAHIRLESSSPARDEVLTAVPTQLRLLFSARIEPRYTTVSLRAPDGTAVPVGAVVFAEGSDRDISVRLPALDRSGVYVVHWRTAGADGHVLEGSFSFLLDMDSARADPLPDSAAADPTGHAVPDAGHPDHDEPRAIAAAPDAAGRWLHFTALLLLLGAVGFRALLVPRLSVEDLTRAALRRHAWRAVTIGSVVLAVAAVLRLWLQSVALHGADRAWSTQLLSIMLRDTTWGRGWVVQVFLFALLGMAIVWARPYRDRIALFVAIVAVAGLAAVPALTGHAAGAAGLGNLAVANDALHVAAAGTWLGTLAVLMFGGLPVLRRTEPDATRAAADAVHTFSPIALTGASLVVLTGVINTLIHLDTVPQLWSTGYGRVLLVKLGLVAGVALLGWINWRIVRPRLAHGDAIRRLRLSATSELLFAVLVLIATAVLAGQPRP